MSQCRVSKTAPRSLNAASETCEKNEQSIFREPSTKKQTFKGFSCLPWLALAWPEPHVKNLKFRRKHTKNQALLEHSRCIACWSAYASEKIQILLPVPLTIQSPYLSVKLLQASGWGPQNLLYLSQLVSGNWYTHVLRICLHFVCQSGSLSSIYRRSHTRNNAAF